MNDVDLQAWLADVLARIAKHPVHQLHELLPWNWQSPRQPARCHLGAERVTVVGAVSEQHVALAERAGTVGGAPASCAWPGVSLRAIGRPRTSTSTWILVVSPPRERPMHPASASCPAATCGPPSCHLPHPGERESTNCRSSARRPHRYAQPPRTTDPDPSLRQRTERL